MSMANQYDEAYSHMDKLTCQCDSDGRLIHFLYQEIKKFDEMIEMDKKMILRIKSEIKNLSKTVDSTSSSGKGSEGVASSVYEVHSSFLFEILYILFFFCVLFLCYHYFKKHQTWFLQKYE